MTSIVSTKNGPTALVGAVGLPQICWYTTLRFFFLVLHADCLNRYLGLVYQALPNIHTVFYPEYVRLMLPSAVGIKSV